MRREDVIAKAREFLGTPLAHQGRIKGKRIDCVGLVLCVADELGLFDKNGNSLGRNDHLNYGPQPLGNLVHETTKERLVLKWEASQKTPMPELTPGDVLTIRNPSAACHAGIVSSLNGSLSIIHAYAVGPELPGLRNKQRVCEHVIDADWRRRIEGIFEFPGVQSSLGEKNGAAQVPGKGSLGE